VTRLTIGVVGFIQHNVDQQIYFTKKCVESIRKYVKEDHNLIIIDNGSVEAGANALRDMNPEYLIRFPENYGVVHAYNTIMDNCKTELAYIPNNDHMLSENSVDNMIKHLDNTDYELLGSPESTQVLRDYSYKKHQNNFNNSLHSLFVPDNFDSWNDVAQKFIKKYEGVINDKEFPCSNYLMKKETWEKFGKFRLSTYGGWNALDRYANEDCDKADIKYGTCMESIIYHIWGGMGTTKFVSKQIPDSVKEKMNNFGVTVR